MNIVMNILLATFPLKTVTFAHMQILYKGIERKQRKGVRKRKNSVNKSCGAR